MGLDEDVEGLCDSHSSRAHITTNDHVESCRVVGLPYCGGSGLKPIVRRSYEAAGHPERFKVYQPENTHVYLAEYFEWVAAWLKEHLDA